MVVVSMRDTSLSPAPADGFGAVGGLVPVVVELPAASVATANLISARLVAMPPRVIVGVRPASDRGPPAEMRPPERRSTRDRIALRGRDVGNQVVEGSDSVGADRLGALRQHSDTPER